MATLRLEDSGVAFEFEPSDVLTRQRKFTVSPDDVAHRVGDLSPQARQLSTVASVFGPTFSIDDAGEVLGEPVGRLLPWVREIVDAGIVVAEEQAFAFVDDATREAIY